MSNNLVHFLNIGDFKVDLNRQPKIAIEYVVEKGVGVSPSDWVAIYPLEANFEDSIALNLIIAYEFALFVPSKKGERKYKIEFSLKGANSLKYGYKYQFVYISRSSEIYGISEPFEFLPPALNKLDKSMITSRDSDDTKENSEENNSVRDFHKNKSKRKQQQFSVKVESDKSEEGKGGSGDQKEAKKFINKFKNNKQVFVRKQTEACCGVHRPSPAISCSNCHRVAGLLRAQDELYTKIKSMAEENSDLRGQVCHLQRRAELCQAACQKLTVTLRRERHAKQFFQAAAFERMDLGYQIMVVPGSPCFVSTSRQPPTERHVEDKPRGCSVLRLKATLGHQEERIRSLTRENAQLKKQMEQRATTARTVEVKDRENKPSSEGKNKEVTVGVVKTEN